jgi:hypothetical protein
MSISAETILKKFNIVTTGDVTTSSDIEGAAIIGGNLNGATFFNNSSDLPNAPVIYLYGQQYGNLNIDNGGTLYIGAGDQQGTVNLNGGAKIVTGVPDSAAYYTSVLTSLSSQLSGLSDTTGASVTAVPNDTTFNSGAGANGVAVLNISSSQLAQDMSGTTINFNVQSGVTMVINVTGGGAFAENGNWNTIQPDVIFNFESNASLSVTQFDASILAPGATVTSSSPINGTLFAANFDGNGEIHDYTFQGTLPPVCYAAGTLIATADGERAVETLRPGDIVTTLSLGTPIDRPVRWVGHRRVDIAASPHPERLAPVRIVRSAFAPDVPNRDLLVSPDHAIFVDGVLIAARQLVNGVTVRQDAAARRIDYYHVELASHDILLAQGLAAESYLDTGNRGFFANAAVPATLVPDLPVESGSRVRETSCCVPFVWEEACVKPAWQRLADRAAVMGRAVTVPETTTDPALYLEVAGGTIRPLQQEKGLFTFFLPEPVSEVRIRSRANRPTDTRPWLEERRRLGVYVERIVIKRPNGEVSEVPVDHPALSEGWWAVEREGSGLRRWTDGDAVLPLPGATGLLQLRIAEAAMTYTLPVPALRRSA